MYRGGNTQCYEFAGKPQPNLPFERAAFTLIEMLVVVLILAILMSVALPLYIDAAKNSAIKACRANMQTIADAEVAYKVKNPSHVFTTDLSSSGALVADGNLTIMPVCPNGGTYSIALNPPDGSGLITVHCSIAGDDDDGGLYSVNHGFTPGFDRE